MKKKIISFSIVFMVLCSIAFADESGFFMTLELTERRMKKLEGISVGVVETVPGYSIVKIEFSAQKYQGITEIILEKRDKKQQLLLGIPIACKKEQKTYRAELKFSKTQMTGSEILLYVSRDVMKDELQRFYQEIPDNLLGICYKINLETLKQSIANKPDAGNGK